MSEKLPVGNIRKLSNSEKNRFIKLGLQNHDENRDVGHWVVIDVVKVADEVARISDERPLIIHHMKIDKKDLSPYHRALSAFQNKIHKKKLCLTA